MCLVALLLASFVVSCTGAMGGEDVTPTDGMIIRSSLTLRPGTYHLPRGVRVEGHHVTVKADGVRFVGNFTKDTKGAPAVGMTVEGYDGVSVTGLSARGYFYGFRASNCSLLSLQRLDLSNNYVDPASRSAKPPWLDIFVKPEDFASDRTNFGGGVILQNVKQARISGVEARNGENGVDAFNMENSVIEESTFSNQSGWGIHLYQSSHNKIRGNTADNCTRSNLGDSAGLLLACSSSHNSIEGNLFRYGGDGVYLAWTPPNQGDHPSCCSNTHNKLVRNDASHAGANAFEADFSWHNEFHHNTASGSNFGFWLGYSRFCHLSGNKIFGNEWNGIAIDHGQDNLIEGNDIFDNGHSENVFSPWRATYSRGWSVNPPPWQKNGILLWSDLTDPYPATNFTCLKGYDHRPSRNYTVVGNIFSTNGRRGDASSAAISLQNTTDSLFFNNILQQNSSITDFAQTSGWTHAGNAFSLAKPVLETNAIGGKKTGGNFYSTYTGCDKDGDGLGDTPFSNDGLLAPADPFPMTNIRC